MWEAKKKSGKPNQPWSINGGVIFKKSTVLSIMMSILAHKTTQTFLSFRQYGPVGEVWDLKDTIL